MRTGFSIVTLFVLLLPTAFGSTTLRLSGDMDLLILDGKKVSSSLLKGADSVELDNGPHQLVLRVEKNIRIGARYQRLYTSAPLVISFNTEKTDLVNFVLPPIEDEKGSQHFDAAPQIQLLDGNAVSIPLEVDWLYGKPGPRDIDYESDTQRYNLANKTASIPAFAVTGFDERAPYPPAPQPETMTGQRLKYWYLQADSTTRASFLQWLKEEPDR